MRPLIRLFDAAALRHNWQAIRTRAHAKKLFAVVKSRGYGHGCRFVVDALGDLADGFALVEIADAKTVRMLGIDKPVLLMNGAFSGEDMTEAAELNLWLAVHNRQQVQWLLEAPAKAKFHVFVKVNIGMNRLGFSPTEAVEIMDVLSRAKSVSQIILMAHFADADSPDGIQKPLEILQPLRTSSRLVSLGNSATCLFHGDLADDWGRVGIALYGSSPAPLWHSRESLGLRPAMILKSRIISTRTVSAGETIGYGSCWRADSDIRVGVVACGYGDGYPRATNLWAQISGQKTDVLGRVSMELFVVSLSNCPSANIGDEVICWGESPSVDEVATAAGRVSYELLVAAGRD